MASQLQICGTSSHPQARLPSFLHRSILVSATQSRRTSFTSPVRNLPPARVRCTAASANLVQSAHPPNNICLHHEIELPALIPSMAINGLPPRQQSTHEDEAEKLMLEIARRWQVPSFESYFRLALDFTSYVHSKAVCPERLLAISMHYALAFILDDLLFDSPNDYLLKGYGVNPSIRDSPNQIVEFATSLNTIFRLQDMPYNLSPIEGMMWELGQMMRRLSTPKWFNTFANTFIEHQRVSVESHADIASNCLCVHDVESYSQMRAGNVGGSFSLMLVEFGNEAFLPDKVRMHPFIQEVNYFASLHMSYVNDIFSYDKELQEPDNPRNLIKVLMYSEGIPLSQAVWRSVELANMQMHAITELETQLLVKVQADWVHYMRSYLVDLKEALSGNLHWSSMTRRYRDPNSIFPELRDITKVKSLESRASV